MINTKKQLIVKKSDSSCEPYMHTKIIGTISNALDSADQSDIIMAQNLAEVVTYYIYDGHGEKSISTNQIFSVIKATLTSAEYYNVAAALENHHWRRKLKRSRTFVASVDIKHFSDAHILCEAEKNCSLIPWEKGIIVNDLMTKQKLSRQPARMIASIVEEKIFKMDMMLIAKSLINQLVWTDTARVTRAQKMLVDA